MRYIAKIDILIVYKTVGKNKGLDSDLHCGNIVKRIISYHKALARKKRMLFKYFLIVNRSRLASSAVFIGRDVVKIALVKSCPGNSFLCCDPWENGICGKYYLNAL